MFPRLIILGLNLIVVWGKHRNEMNNHRQETNINMIEYLEKLINNVAIELEVQSRTPQSFNIYDLCGIKHYETKHSAILAGLLRWHGSRKPLQNFIHIFSDIHLSEQELKIALIQTERNVIIDGEERRLDILIKIGNSFLTIIENKIYTDDHDQQLLAYSKWLDNQQAEHKYLIYLTLDGSPSIEGCPENKYIRWSYREEIILWLKECLAFTQFDLHYHFALFQYQEFWEKWFMETNELNGKIIPLITATATSFNSAKQIRDSFWEARKYLITKTLQEWQDKTLQKCQDKGLKLVSRADAMTGGKYDQFFFRYNDYGYVLSIG